jgi:hypothetical protein
MTLLVLIPTAWLVATTLCLAVCWAAARDDEALAAAPRRRSATEEETTFNSLDRCRSISGHCPGRRRGSGPFLPPGAKKRVRGHLSPCPRTSSHPRRSERNIAHDTKLTESAGEHHVCSELARRDWGSFADPRHDNAGHDRGSSQGSAQGRELAARSRPAVRVRAGVVCAGLLGRRARTAALLGGPRDHAAAGTWISHMSWPTDSSVNRSHTPSRRGTSVRR